jgi:hypothetical protein
MMTFYTPSDETLAAWGLMSVRHSSLEHILRMTVKTLTEVTVEEALDATASESIAILRRRIRDLARKRLGEGKALVKLEPLVERSHRVTRRRNEFVHGVWAFELSSDEPIFQTNDHKRKPIPTVNELRQLSNDIARLVSEINDARLEGFLHEALRKK